MEMLEKEKRFYDALGVAPEVPEGVLRGVLQNSRRRGIFMRWSVAACLAFALAMPMAFAKFGVQTVAAVSDVDSFEDVFYAFEYVNGKHDGEIFLAGGNQYSLLTGIAISR